MAGAASSTSLRLVTIPASKSPSVGGLLVAWRKARGKSQLTLALEAGVSTRHLSFIETGRSSPSREMVLALAETLDVPLRERNALLEAAGFAAAYRETPLDAPQMADIRGSLAQILAAHTPNPALLVNRRYDILMANDAALRLVGHFARSFRGKNNVAELLLSHEGLRPSVVNWREVTSHVIHRIRAELSQLRARDIEDEAMLRRAVEAESELEKMRGAAASTTAALLLPMRLRCDEGILELFTTITTLGTPFDITLQELRIETLFPANDRSRERLLEIVSPLPPT